MNQQEKNKRHHLANRLRADSDSEDSMSQWGDVQAAADAIERGEIDSYVFGGVNYSLNYVDPRSWEARVPFGAKEDN